MPGETGVDEGMPGMEQGRRLRKADVEGESQKLQRQKDLMKPKSIE